MIKPVIIFLTILLCHLSWNAYTNNTDEIKRLKGILVAKHDLVPVKNAHIINISRATGVISSSEGLFSINIRTGDTLMFQALGFINDTLIISEVLFSDNAFVMIQMESKVYELSRVDIYPYGTYSQFKNAFINFEHSEKEINLNLPVAHSNLPATTNGGIVIPGPITFFYEQFGRKAKNMRKYLHHTYEDELTYKASLIINYSVVKQLTPMESEKEIESFLAYCNMSREFIINNHKYLVYQTLLACYNEYKKNE